MSVGAAAIAAAGPAVLGVAGYAGGSSVREPIKGYRTLTPEEIAVINRIKAIGEELSYLVDAINSDGGPRPEGTSADGLDTRLMVFEACKASGRLMDKRWGAIARTELQQGFMALTRAVAQPTNF